MGIPKPAEKNLKKPLALKTNNTPKAKLKRLALRLLIFIIITVLFNNSFYCKNLVSL